MNAPPPSRIAPMTAMRAPSCQNRCPPRWLGETCSGVAGCVGRVAVLTRFAWTTAGPLRPCVAPDGGVVNGNCDQSCPAPPGCGGGETATAADTVTVIITTTATNSTTRDRRQHVPGLPLRHSRISRTTTSSLVGHREGNNAWAKVTFARHSSCWRYAHRRPSNGHGAIFDTLNVGPPGLRTSRAPRRRARPSS